MTKSQIIEHYKKYFDLHAKGIPLDEEDHVNLDWAETLIEEATRKEKLEIKLIHWDYVCGDGCCHTYGQDIELNGETLFESNADSSQLALKAVLKRLGYEVEIEELYEDE